ncbi:hypothetical protein LCGC14_1743030 [marine sediment metagenome]|uniref:Uncharacterized protein n=1 Tax=marine sediment metagenome TaxID=412755 RepID=A0A0F9JLE1_9ZZZZ
MNCSYCGEILTKNHTFSYGVPGAKYTNIYLCPECKASRKSLKSLIPPSTRTVAEIRRMFEALKQQRDKSVSLSYARTVTNLYARALAWVLKDPQVESLLLPEEAKRLYESVS